MLNFDVLCAKSDYLKTHVDKLKILLQTQCRLDFVQCILFDGPEGAGKWIIANAAAKSLSINLRQIQIAEIIGDTIVGSEKRLRQQFDDVTTTQQTVVYLSNFEFLCQLKRPELAHLLECIKDCLSTKLARNCTLIASASSYQDVYTCELSSIFQHFVHVKQASEKEVLQLLINISQLISIDFSGLDESLLVKCLNDKAYLGNLLDLMSQIKMFKTDNEQLGINHVLEKVLEDNASIFGKNLNDEKDLVAWEDVGGLKNVKQEIIDTIQLSIDYPQLSKSGLKRTGVLLYGPPGTGKTLLARAIASECNMNFINVKGPELINMYVGQSEENIRKLFQSARESAPSVIFFDELDSLAPNRGQAGDSGGVMDRIVSQILTELDTWNENEQIFVIGATNRIDLVDPSLLRPGRFDTVLEVPLPKDKESRLAILRALTKKMKLDDDVELEWIESELKNAEMSGADFQGLCSLAVQYSIDRYVILIKSGVIAENEVNLITSKQDFLMAIQDSLRASSGNSLNLTM